MQPPGGDDGRRYRIVRRLGHGGMAEVFEAVLTGQHGFTRRVAIKRISTRAADDPELAERFLDEARIASQLHHAGIVGILDYGFVDGLPFQVLEFVDGLDADRLIDRAGGTVPADIALIITADVAHALDHAHRARGADGAPLGIVHRDVKPANVLVSWDGDVKLSDFGIAIARGRVAQTEAGMARGTPWFMAPEQRTKSEIGPPTDVFALGCTLHALLTGRSPLVDLEVAMRVISGEPAPLDATLPPDIRAVVAKACAPAADDRYADCGAFADALGRLAAQRLRRDARGRLREYLAALRKPTGAAGGAGLLDQLLAVDLILASDSRGEVASAPTREFTLRQTQPGPADAPPGDPRPSPGDPLAQPAPASGPAPLADELEPDAERPRRRTALWLVLVLFIGGATGGGIWLATHRGASAHATAPIDATSVALAPVDAPPPPPQPDAAEPPRVVDAVPSATADARSHSDHDRPDAHAPPSDRPDAGTPPPPARDGYVRLSGEAFGRSEIFIDGHSEGFAPNPIKTTVGTHKLKVRKPDGTVLGPITIEVTPYNTKSSPYRPQF